MPSARLSTESTPVEAPLQQRPKSPHSDTDAAPAEHPLERGVAERESNGWQTLISYISGGQGGSGGGGGLHGGAGGTGEGTTLNYDIKAERIIMKTFNSPEATPSDFIRIPLGNIDLRNEIQVDAATGAVWRHREQKRTTVRRMYSARVIGHNEPMTVALYQGHNAEEEWKRDLTRHSGLRHPHILQIYASASSSGMHAVVFHDGATTIAIIHLELVEFNNDIDFVPWGQFFDSFRHSAILTAYILWYMTVDWSNAYNYYMRNVTMQGLVRYSIIACSTTPAKTGGFDAGARLLPGPPERSPPRSVLSLHSPNQESLVIASLGYPEWYHLCESYLRQGRSNSVSARAESYKTNGLGGTDGVLNSGERMTVPDVFGRVLSLSTTISAAPWLAQANYLFSQLKIVSNDEDYRLVTRVEFSLNISETRDRAIYLFVHRKISSLVQRRPLSDEEASSLGFPPITQKTEVYSKSWDETVYAGLRKFDECKGFDLDSQDLAKELGHPLYEVCVPTSVATKWNFAVDRDDESNHLGTYLEDKYLIDGEMESNSHLASSCVEVLTMDNENFIEEFSSDESDCSNSYPEDGVREIESNPSSCNQELTVENEDSLRNLPSHETIVAPYYSTGELAELVKFGLIVVLGLMTLYEYAGALSRYHCCL
ncbi:hypothetical protein MSAN_01102600 [Mycena sanguinolenta]|uniref:Uncharacterized protein n=1 Tax=Mycena sanguinolenta TaxID=230812 RepID=A0A8H6YT64_9AGAR|nr:hypothetical protein MSAN_01102600 [Mycena sanguinolenta]